MLLHSRNIMMCVFMKFVLKFELISIKTTVKKRERKIEFNFFALSHKTASPNKSVNEFLTLNLCLILNHSFFHFMSTSLSF